MMIALIPTKIGLVDVDKQTGDSQACLFLPEKWDQIFQPIL